MELAIKLGVPATFPEGGRIDEPTQDDVEQAMAAFRDRFGSAKLLGFTIAEWADRISPPQDEGKMYWSVSLSEGWMTTDCPRGTRAYGVRAIISEV